MMLCLKCSEPILRNDLVRIVCICRYVQPSSEGYGLDFISQEHIEHNSCNPKPWYIKFWLKVKMPKEVKELL